MTGLYDAVRAVAERTPSRVAVVSAQGSGYTYADLMSVVDRMTGHLAARGVQTGTTVAFALRSSPEYVALILAVARLGARYVPLLENTDRAAVRLLSGYSMIVTDLSVTADVPVVALADLTTAGPEAPHRVAKGVFRYLWSSGSTGVSKMIAWRQDRFVAERRRWLRHTRITARDVFLCRHPLDVAHATDLHVFAALLAGATVAMIDPDSTATEVRDRLVAVGATVMSALPSHYDELAVVGGADLSRLRRPLCGGAYLSPAVIERCAVALGIGVRQIYGSTEFGLALGDVTGPPHRDGRMTTVDGVVARLAPVADIPPEMGELVLISDCTSEGYVGSPEAHRRTFRSDGFWTGDLATRLPDGGYRILGRLSEVLAGVGGPITAPALDDALTAHPAVRNAITLPVRPGGYGSDVLVAVEPATTEAAAIDGARQILAAQKLNGTVRCVQRLHRTPVGKVDKAAMRILLENAR